MSHDDSYGAKADAEHDALTELYYDAHVRNHAEPGLPDKDCEWCRAEFEEECERYGVGR